MNEGDIDQALLDRYVLGELSKEEDSFIEMVAATDTDLKEQIGSLRESLTDMAVRGRIEPPGSSFIFPACKEMRIGPECRN